MTPRKRRTGVVAALALGVTTLTGVQVLGASIETPDWDLVAEHDGWEVRRYAPKLEAQVTVRANSYGEAVNQGFRVLAKFIFGANQGSESVAMTAPVSASQSTKIAMTAPVGASTSADGWTVTFTMPSEYTMETLPRPVDPSIRIVQVPGGTWAAREFAGRAEKRHEELTTSLEEAIRGAGLRPAGPPEVAQYNPPWIPGPFRRNEILIPLE